VQAVALPPALELPAGQSEQARSAAAEPGCAADTTEPAAHVVHAVHEEAPAAEKEPAAHGMHALAPSAAYVPAAHGLHATSLVGVPGVEGQLPGAHVLKGVQAEAPEAAAKPPTHAVQAAPLPGEAVPAAQRALTVSEEAVQGAVTPLPGGLDEHAMQADCPATDAKVWPATHAVQLEAPAAADEPTAHSERTVFALAEHALTSAEPLAGAVHAAHEVEPAAAAKVPPAHGLQAGCSVKFANVPGAQSRAMPSPAQ
jgi:hypothetical protein